MASFSNIISKSITREVNGTAARMLQKLNEDNSKNNVSTITFPHGLENQAQCTYMAIYILENTSNKEKFNTSVFESNIDEDTYEIGAITWLKDTAKEALEDLKNKAKSTYDSVVKTGTDWLLRQKDALIGDIATELEVKKNDIQETISWVDRNFIPHRKSGVSTALEDKLDPTKNPMNGYRLEKVIHIQMPTSDITYKYENGWESVDTSNLNMIKSLISGLTGLFQKDRGAATEKLKSVADRIGNALGDMVTGGGYTAEKQGKISQVYNPVLVFNYTVPTPRTFSYSFQLYPRNKDELYTLFNMIQMLKYYALPEIPDSDKVGAETRPMTFNYPAKFAIKFFTNGYENKWFPKTMALGLTSIEETLTGDNGDMAFFENYFDTASGNPPRIVNLTLTFKELGIMSRQAANLGY